MTQRGDFAFDHRRVTGALALDPPHFAEYQRLVKTISFGPGFQFLIVEFNDVAYRTQLAAAIDDMLKAEGVAVHAVDLHNGGFNDVSAFEATIRSLGSGSRAIHVFGGEAWFDGARIEAFNIRREAFSQIGPIKMLLWLTSNVIEEIAKRAPDLWAWRGSVVFSFVRAPSPALTLSPVLNPRGPIIAPLSIISAVGNTFWLQVLTSIVVVTPYAK